MRIGLLYILAVLTPILLGACSGAEIPQITPADDKLTFLFFYTDG